MFSINHDLHSHSGLSSCSSDPSFSAQHLLDHAVACGYDMIALTNHVWDPLIPGVTEWYRPQDINHIRKALPLPQAEGIRFLFGCETEYGGSGTLALHPSHYNDFDLILVPVNHYNIMPAPVYDPSYSAPANYLTCQVDRLETLLEYDLPWKRVGIAHLQWYEVTEQELPAMLALEERYRAVFREYSRRGAGIELNAASLAYTNPEMRPVYDAFSPERKEGCCIDHEKVVWLFSLAKEAGCKFYIGSDSHTSLRLDWPRKYLARICQDLGLEDSDRFIPVPMNA